MFFCLGKKKKVAVEDITLSSDDEIEQKAKAALKKITVDAKIDDEYQVGKKDENGKEIDFVQWFPASLLPKPARSPVCTIILKFFYPFNFLNVSIL